jgi:hypothetical protein
VVRALLLALFILAGTLSTGTAIVSPFHVEWGAIAAFSFFIAFLIASLG